MNSPSHIAIHQLTLEESQLIRGAQRPPSGWAADFPTDVDVVVASHVRYTPTSTVEPWSSPWLIEEDGVVVGMLGFKGAPVAHRVDVGYGISPSARGRGVATAALSLLLGQIQNRALTVRAETALGNVASQAVVRHCNFEDVGRVHNVDDGELIVWELFVD